MTSVSADSVCSVRRPSAGDQQQSSALLSDRDVKGIIESKIRSDKFCALSWTLKPLNQSNGFLGQYYTLVATVTTIDGKTRSFNFFAKTPPPSDSPQYDFLQRFNTFNKEISIYTDVLRRIGVGSASHKWIVECYLGKKDTIIVLEDATVDGYVTPDKYVPFDEAHCVLTLKALASFHSRSLIFDEKLQCSGRTILNFYGHLLKEVLFLEGDAKSEAALAASVAGCGACIDLADGLRDEQRRLLKKRVHNWAFKLPRLLQASNKYKNVICHRDAWSNNLLFKYDSRNVPISCYVIDFQFCRYCPPAVDFVCSLYLTTNRAVRDRHFESFMKIYYESMREALTAEGVNIDECLPWLAFRESCIESRKMAMIYAFMNLQIMLLSGEAIEEYFTGPSDRLEEVFYSDKRSQLVSHQYRTLEPYRVRITEVIFEILERLPDYPPANL